MIRELRTLTGIFSLFLGLCWSAMPCVGQRSATAYSDQSSHSQIPLLLDGLPELVPDHSSTANNYSSFIVTTKNERIAPRPSVDWKGLSKDSLQFLVIMN